MRSTDVCLASFLGRHKYHDIGSKLKIPRRSIARRCRSILRNMLPCMCSLRICSATELSESAWASQATQHSGRENRQAGNDGLASKRE